MIRVEQLSKDYGGLIALRDVSFEVGRGEIAGFVGPNGAGKTTALRIIAGFIGATSGKVTVDGHDIASEPLEVRRRIGYMPEAAPLYPEMRVMEYLSFRAALKRVPRRRQVSAVSRAMQQAGVEDVAPVVIAHLSKGYRQRVGLADALVASPPLLILDEPTAGLDPNQIREVRRLIRELGKEHTVFLSTHILSEVESICDRAIVIDRGRIVAEGTLRDLQARRGAVEMELLVVDRGGRSAKLVENSPGVETIEVEALGENRLRLRVRSTDKTSPDALMESLVRILVENQVGVRGATCLKARLEDVFSELTRAETTEAGPGGAQDWSKPAG